MTGAPLVPFVGTRIAFIQGAGGSAQRDRGVIGHPSEGADRFRLRSTQMRREGIATPAMS
jgi:hypothetical protein